MTDLLAIADGLYGLPPAEFTPARDALVREHRADKPLAAAIKALRKPSLAAWVVDLLVRREGDQVAQVLAVGESLREAAAALDGEELRALTRQRRQLTSAVTSLARSTAADEGVRVTSAVAEQVEATLTAAIVDSEAARAVRSGLLIAPLAATGVEPVDAAAAVALPEALGFAATPRSAPEPRRPELSVVPDPEPDESAREDAEAALADAELTLGRTRRAHESAAEEVERHRARTLQVQAEIEELRRRLADLEDDAETADEALAQADSAADAARTAYDEATTARDAAQAALDALT